MPVSETLTGIGSWSLALRDETPDELRKALGFFGRMVVLDGPADVVGLGDAALTAARYVGVLREGASTLNPGGSGMAFWLGEPENGPIVVNKRTYTNQTLSQVVTSLMADAPALLVGTVHPQADAAQRYSGEHQYVDVRTALVAVAGAFGAEVQVTGDGRVNVGTAAQLYGPNPQAVIKRRGTGTDMDLVGVGGEFEPSNDVYEFSTAVVLLGQTQDNHTIVTATQNATGVPYLDPRGNPVKITRLISESGETAGTVAQRAQLQLNRFYRAQRQVSLDLADYETDAPARCGQYVWVFDPDTGLTDAANEIYFRGELLRPVKERVSATTWQVREGMTVGFRTHQGAWHDLTRWIVWETGSDQVTVGDPDGLLTRSSSPAQDRVDATRPGGKVNNVAPKPPTALTLTTESVQDLTGTDVSRVIASWTPPTQNVDNTTLDDLAYHAVQYRVTGRNTWEETTTEDATIALPAAPGLGYQVQVRAVDSDGQASTWTAIATITASKDTGAPPTPSNPLVSNYLGQLRIEWDGLSSTGGAMPADLNRVEVHVGTASGFIPSAATKVDEFTSGTRGVAYATAPYGVTRWARLQAFDHQGNASALSASVSGATSPVVSDDIFDGAVGSAKLANLAVITAKIGDLAVNDAKVGNLSVGKLTAGIMSADVTVSGRFTTSLTGARREMNAVGFQGWDASNNLIINLNGSDNLLQGRFRSALPGTRRVEIDTSVESGSVRLYAPDGKYAQLRGFTDIEGREAAQFGVPRTDLTSDGYYNRITFNYDGKASYRANQHQITYTRDSSALGLNTGYFSVVQAGSEGSTGLGLIEMMRIEQDKILFVQPAAGANFEYRERVVAGNGTVTNWQKFFITDDDFWFRFHRIGRGDARITGGGGDGSHSPKLFLLTKDGNGATVRGGWSSVNGSRLEARNTLDNGYAVMWAANFIQQSTQEVKSDITDADAGPILDKLRLRRYKRLAQAPSQVTEWELGLIAEEAPPEILSMEGKGVSVYSLAAVAAAGARNAARRAAALDARVTDLERQVVSLNAKVFPGGVIA